MYYRNLTETQDKRLHLNTKWDKNSNSYYSS